MNENDSTKRFSKRVIDYKKYRPGYPADAIDFLIELCELDSDSTVADIGAGTGLLSEPLLASGANVVAIEPNDEMRAACDSQLEVHAGYRSLSGTAEHTGLPDHTVDLITAAQAFHWFDVDRARLEFQRVLKSTGRIALIWNRRDSQGGGFQTEYDAMLKSSIPEYTKVSHANASDVLIADFLGPAMKTADFTNHQSFNFEGLKGRLLSSSYCPAVGQDGHEQVMFELEKLFHKYAQHGSVRFNYVTQLYVA